MYQSRVTSTPHSVAAIIWSTDERTAPNTMFMGASPIWLGRGNPCPVGSMGPTLFLCSERFIFSAVARANTSHLTTPFRPGALFDGTFLHRRRERPIAAGGQRHPDLDVLAEEFVPTRLFRNDRSSKNSKVEEHEANDVEHGGGCEDVIFPAESRAAY